MMNIDEILRRTASALNLSSEVITFEGQHFGGLNNESYLIRVKNERLLVRIPGVGTNLFSDRRMEALVYQKLAAFDLSDIVRAYEPDGLKISVFYEDAQMTDCSNERQLAEAARLLRRIQQLPITMPNFDSNYSRTQRFQVYAREAGWQFSSSYLADCKQYLAPDSFSRMADPRYLTHGDFIPGNVLFLPGKTPIVVDWEFPAMGGRWNDLAAFFMHGSLDLEHSAYMLTAFLEKDATASEWQELAAVCVGCSLMWYAWAAYKLQKTGDRLYRNFAENCLKYAEIWKSEVRP